MDVTRRKFLQTASAGAVLSTVPAGLLSSPTAAFGGDGLYAVVSKHATWGVFETLEQARREATLIRKTGFMSTNAVQCSPELARQFELGKLGRFIELDGWALTPEEVEARGENMLRGARHKSAARHQVLDHQLSKLLVLLREHEERRTDTHWYALSGDDDVIGVYDDEAAIPDGVRAARCTHGLSHALKLFLAGECDRPTLFDATTVHALQSEHDLRCASDVVYRVALTGHTDRLDVASLIGPVAQRYVAVARRSRWIFGAGRDRHAALAMAAPARGYLNEDLLVVPASQTLAHAVVANGYEIPAFWRIREGMLRHDVEGVD